MPYGRLLRNRRSLVGARSYEVRALAPGIICRLAGCLRIDRGKHVQEGREDLLQPDRKMRVVGGGEAGKRRGRAVEHFLAALDVDEGVGLGLLGKKTRELVLDIL